MDDLNIQTYTIEKDTKISAVNVCRKYYKKGRLTISNNFIRIVVKGKEIKSLPLEKLTMDLGLVDAWKFLRENGGKYSLKIKEEIFQPISFDPTIDGLINSGYYDNN